MNKSNVESFSLAFHGNVAIYLAQIYADPLRVIREIVQNALDKDARHIVVIIDCVHKTVKAYDDGLGADKAEIVKKLKNIGLTLKVDDPEAIGQKGIGNLAGIAIAETYRLITKDIGNQFDSFKVYELKREDIQGQEVPGFTVEPWPYNSITSDVSIEGKKFAVSAMVHLLDVNPTAVRHLSDLDAIEREIADAFSHKIRKNDVKILINFRDSKNRRREKLVRPLSFRGMRMDTEKYNTDFGPVVFDFCFSPRPNDDPKILVEHKGVYTLPIGNLFLRKQLPNEVAEIVNKGYFEGLVRIGFCNLTSSRDCFGWDQEFEVFRDVVSTFTAKVLKPIVDQIEEELREERYRRVSDTIVKKMVEHFKSNPFLLPPQFRTIVSSMADEKDAAKKAKRPDLNGKFNIDRSLLHRQREKSSQEAKEPLKKEGGLRKDRVIIPKWGLQFHYIYPDSGSGFAWHSRLSKEGFVEINTANVDFLGAERLGFTKLVEYVFLVLQKEMTCSSLEPAVARIFGEHFEGEYMKYWRACLS